MAHNFKRCSKHILNCHFFFHFGFCPVNKHKSTQDLSSSANFKPIYIPPGVISGCGVPCLASQKQIWSTIENAEKLHLYKARRVLILYQRNFISTKSLWLYIMLIKVCKNFNNNFDVNSLQLVMPWGSTDLCQFSSRNGLSPIHCQAITWTRAHLQIVCKMLMICGGRKVSKCILP